MSQQRDRHELKRALQFLGLVTTNELDDFPDFLVIAPPKTGTSWLAQQLRSNPHVFVPQVKETKYFNHCWKSKNLAWYLSFFQEAAGRRKGEATPNYAVLPTSTIRLIHDLRPELKLVFLMRNPVERAWSHVRWNHRLQNGSFSSFDGTIDEVSDVMWQESFLGSPIVLFGDYLGQLQRWLDVFARSQIFIGFTEQIQSSPRDLLNSIFDFLGVERPVQFDDVGLSERVNAGVTRRLTPELRDYLHRIYGGRTRQLVDFLRREFAIEPPAEWNELLAASHADTFVSHDAGHMSPDNLCDSLAQSVDDEQLNSFLDLEEHGHPYVAQSYLDWNIIRFRGNYYGVPWSVGSVDFFDGAQLARPEILVAATALEIRADIDQMVAGNEALPVLVQENHSGYNLVDFRGTHLALAQSLGPVDLTQVDDAWQEARLQSRELFVGETLAAVQQQIDQYVETLRSESEAPPNLPDVCGQEDEDCRFDGDSAAEAEGDLAASDAAADGCKH